MPSIKGLRPQALKELLASIATAPPSVFADVSIDLLLSSAAALERAAVAPRTTRYINVESATDFEAAAASALGEQATDNPIVAFDARDDACQPTCLAQLDLDDSLA